MSPPFNKYPLIHLNSFFLTTLKFSSIFISLIISNIKLKHKTPSRFKNQNILSRIKKKMQYLILISNFFKKQVNFGFNLSFYKQKS